jgi:hypothetical protein
MAENVNITIKAFDKTKKGFGTVTSGLKKVTGAVFSMRTALVGVAGLAGFGLLVKSSLNATDSLAKTAAKIGTTTESLGGLRYAAELTGVATNTMDMALQRFTRRTAEAAMGTGEAKAAIKELGLNAQELNRMPLDKRMVVLADAFSGVTNESDRLRLAFKLFDSEGAALVNTLSGGGDALKEMLGEAKMLGLTMSGSAAKGVEDTVDALTKLKSVFKGVTDQVVAALAPAIEGMVERFTAFLQRSIEAKGGVEQFARALAVDLLQGVQSALVAFQELANGFITVYNGALEAKDALTQVFTPDSKKNARQLRQEIDELGKLLANRAKKIEGETAKQRRSSELTQASDLKRLMGLQALLIQADETGGGLSRMAKVDFATRINAQIDAMVGNLENVKTNIVDLPKAIVPAIGNMEQAFTTWRDTIPDLDVSIKSLTTQGLNGLTDALTAGVTGAANFADAMKSMAKSVIDSLIKMLIQKYIVDAAFGFISNKIGGGINTGGDDQFAPNFGPQLPPSPRAIGGSVQNGSPYMVGERGPELFIPNSQGSIVPNNKMSGGGGGGVTVNQTINITTGIQSTVRAEIINLLPAISKASQNGVADARLRGGNFSRAMGGA